MPAVQPSPDDDREFEPLSLSPRGAAAYAGYSLSTIYRLLNAGHITARRDGARTLIDGASIRAYQKTLPAYVPGVSIPNAKHITSARRKTRRARR
jgi:excisionase family DNA binding protein